MKNATDKMRGSISDLKWFPYVLSAIGAIAFSQYFGSDTASFFTLIFFILMLPMFRYRYSAGMKASKESFICSFFFSLFTVSASQISDLKDKNLFAGLDSFSAYFTAFIMFFIFYEALIYILFRKISDADLSEEKTEPSIKRKFAVFFGSMAVMLIMWLPISLFLYPAVITEDSIWQLRQAMGIDELTNHHPVLHTMIIKLCFSIGQWLFDGDDTRSVRVYAIIQQLFLSGCFAYLIETLYKFKAKKKVIICSLLFYVIPVYHAAYSVTMWKDVWFGGTVAVLTSLIWRLLCKEKKFMISVPEAVILFVFSVFMCLMRSNGLYAFVLLFIAAFFVFLRRSKLTVGIMAAALAASLVIKGPLYSYMGVKPGDLIESLSIPAQQIACVARNTSNLSPEQKALLDKVIDTEMINEKYYSSISDNIKNLVREKDNQDYLAGHKSDYLKLWIDLGLEYPDKYVAAFIDQTYGYWFPDVQYWVTSEKRLSDGFEIESEPKTGVFTDFITFYMNSYIETPFLGLIWSIGMGVWVFIFMLLTALKRHKRSVFLVYLPVLGIWLTLLIATPVASEFRYIYSLFTCMPLFCTIPFLKNGICVEKKKKEESSAEKNETLEDTQTEKAEAEA